MQISTSVPGLNLRSANIHDCSTILGLIRELAEYEKLGHELVATLETLQESLFGDTHYAEVLIAEFEDAPVGYSLFFHNFSTFTGRPGIYLEDIYVQPPMRGKGIGKSMLS